MMRQAARTGGQLIVAQLECQRVERIFCVPGESFLAVLDALHDSSIDVVTCRQEGGAAMMAEAHGKLTARPGIVMVTRGPGATNAAAGVHVARQDSTPMILFIGQVARSVIGRDAFQEVDHVQVFAGLAKWAVQIDNAARVPEIVSRAYHVALSGRPGPVVIAVPEDMLREVAEVADAPEVRPAGPAPTPVVMHRALAALSRAQRPLVIVGGSLWTSADRDMLIDFVEYHELPVAVSFRRQMLFPTDHDHHAGELGVQRNASLLQAVEEADCLLALGARLGDIATQGYGLLSIPVPHQLLIHVYPDAGELGRVYASELGIVSTPSHFLQAEHALRTTREGVPLESDPARDDTHEQQQHAASHKLWREALRQRFEAWQKPPTPVPGALQPVQIIERLNACLPDDAIVTNGAGNYAGWVHRFYRFRDFNTQLAPVSGSMGYGLPAAIAAKLQYPERTVIAFAGDGCLMMSVQEFATAVQRAAAVVVIVLDNAQLGTIRMHQERQYPNRVSATHLKNPDFAALAVACGGHGETVRETSEFDLALARSRQSSLPALIHCHLDPRAIAPELTLDDLHARASDPE